MALRARSRRALSTNLNGAFPDSTSRSSVITPIIALSLKVMLRE